MRKFWVLLLSCILMTISLTACGSGEKKLVGAWTLESACYKYTNAELNIEHIKERLKHGVSTTDPEYMLYEKYDDICKIEFFSDGTCTVDGEHGTWKITDGKLMLLGSYGGDFRYASSIVGEFKVSNNKLEFFDAKIGRQSNASDLVYRKLDQFKILHEFVDLSQATYIFQSKEKCPMILKQSITLLEYLLQSYKNFQKSKKKIGHITRKSSEMMCPIFIHLLLRC